MEKIVLTVLALLIGLALFAQMGKVKAGNGKDIGDNVTRIQDGNTVCYIYKEYVYFGDTNYIGGISCVRIK